MGKEIDTQYTKEIVCPYCGYEFGDSWEMNDYNGEVIDCGSCDKEFNLEVDYDVTYCTNKLDEKTDAEVLK